MKKQEIKEPVERVTIRHVAHDAGVSVAAVSKVLRNAYGVSEALRLKVETSIEKLRYRPSVAARAMRGRTYTVGILVIDLFNPFLPPVIDAVNEALSQSGYKTMIGVGRGASVIEASMIETMIDNRMDGVILVAPRISDRMVERFAEQIPIVVIGHHEPEATGYDTVNSDDRIGAMLAVRCLHDRGYRDIAMVGYDRTGSPPSVVSLQREVGYQEAMRDLDLADRQRILRLPPPEEPRDEAIKSLLAHPGRPRALFVWSDLDAVPILAAAREAGLRVPTDLAVIGYDNSPVAALPLVDLASIDQDPSGIGRSASDLLLSRIEGRREAEHVLIQPRVIARGSL
ncbi:transcriptional regulator, LacI family [Rhizobium sp. RU35A]|uniref:LacI family DNA-binding transcriptional regulator n=1 Tax=Rhizobium sp. RU35A TaxID=1907414 RepID=UPI000955EF1B|nr:LacI family DNA-binding transcriptional regulator [Rhizobium sp. RU35A]SIQ33330.1 transcriptional regulator, LacI family [Rhizobium sp. RU35A]